MLLWKRATEIGFFWKVNKIWHNAT